MSAVLEPQDTLTIEINSIYETVAVIVSAIRAAVKHKQRAEYQHKGAHSSIARLGGYVDPNIRVPLAVSACSSSMGLPLTSPLSEIRAGAEAR